MVSIWKKRQQKSIILSQLDTFDQDVIIGGTAYSGRQNFIVNDGTVDREFTVNNSGSIPTIKENTVKVQTLERCFNETIDREMGNIVDTVDDRIQNPRNLTAINNIIIPWIELPVRSINASSGRDVASVTANSERGERIGITVSYDNVSEKSNTFHELNKTDETQGNIPDDISEKVCLKNQFRPAITNLSQPYSSKVAEYPIGISCRTASILFEKMVISPKNILFYTGSVYIKKA